MCAGTIVIKLFFYPPPLCDVFWVDNLVDHFLRLHVSLISYYINRKANKYASNIAQLVRAQHS